MVNWKEVLTAMFVLLTIFFLPASCRRGEEEEETRATQEEAPQAEKAEQRVGTPGE